MTSPISPGPGHGHEPHALLLRRLARRRSLARLIMLFEAVWPGLWPPLGVAGLFLVVALLDVPRVLPPWPHALLLLGFGVAVAVLLVRGLAQIRVPGDAAADRRLEREAGLAHRPLAALTDRPVFTGAEALWLAHVARAAAQLGRLRIGWPHPGLAAHDRRALRGGLVVALAAAAIVAGSDAPERVARAFSPGFPPRPTPPAPLLQAWITPPAYTAVAPLFLKPDGPSDIAVPAGSHLTVSLTGGTGQPSLLLNGHPDPFRALDKSSFQADRDLNSGGRLVVRRRGRELAAWDLTVVADTPPTAAWAEPPGKSPQGLRVRLPWRAWDDYGVVSLEAELRLRDRPDAPPLVIAIPLPGGTPKSAHGTALDDLTANPWAGLPVIGRLVARDAPGQKGASEEAAFALPERDFHNPMARIVVQARKMLSLDPDSRVGPVRLLDQVSATAELFGSDLGAYLNLRAIASLLRENAAPGSVAEAQSRIWQLALHMEEGATERTARALEQARQQLREALDQQARGEPVDPKEIDRLMQQLQQALREHLQALAEQMRRDHSEMPYDPNARQIDPRELERLAQEMRDAAREGKMDQARDREKQLERMMQAMRNARPKHGDPRNAAKRQRGRQEVGALQDMVQRQGALLDHSQARSSAQQQQQQQQQQQPSDPTQPGAAPAEQPGQPPARQSEQQQAGQPNAERGTDQRVQEALRRALGELMQQFGDMTGQVPPSLGDADKAMSEAAQALGQGSDDKAAPAQQRAVEALQKGGRQMNQQMSQMFGNQQGEEEPGEQGQQSSDADSFGDNGTLSEQGNGGQPMPGGEGHEGKRARRDPLGRLTQEGTSGSDESSDVEVPEQMEQVRTRAIEEELRRRGAERERPKQELDYIDRLLKQF